MEKDNKIIIPNDNMLFKKVTNLSPISGAFNFVVMMLGTSMVATAHSFSLSTPYLGVLSVFLLGLWAWLAAISTFNPAAITGATSFIDAGRKIFGTKTVPQKVANIVFIIVPSFIVLIGALAAYIAIASSAVQTYLNVTPLVVQIFWTVIVAALGSINSFENTKFISFFTFGIFVLVASTAVITTFILMGRIDFIEGRSFQFREFVQGLPILALGLNGHMCLPGMAGEMTSCSQKRFPKYLLIGQLIVVVINSSLGFFPSFLFGQCTQGDSIVQLACIYSSLYNATNYFILIAQIALSLAVIIQAPLLVIPLKEIALDNNGKAVRDRSISTNILASCGVALIAGLLSMVLGSITNILNTVSTVGGLMMMGPTAAALSFKTEKTTFSKIRSLILFIGGIALLIINLYTIVVTFSPPPIESTLRNTHFECLCAQ